jgi:hypothetical protein
MSIGDPCENKKRQSCAQAFTVIANATFLNAGAHAKRVHLGAGAKMYLLLKSKLAVTILLVIALWSSLVGAATAAYLEFF